MANKYSGEKCLVCEELFEDGQDIVVCPDCGTPYHRDCWELNGECINTTLHESGENWKPAPKVTFSAGPMGEPIRCIRCGSENEPGKRFCGECGLPLNLANPEQRPFNNEGTYNNDSFNTSHNNGNTEFTPFGSDNLGGFGSPMPNMIKLTPQSDMDGIKLGDLITYIGNRSLNMIASFVKFAKTGKRLSCNIAALLFPHLYFFYRKMYKAGVLYLLIFFLLSVPYLIYGGQTGDLLGMVLFTTPIDLKGDSFLSVYQACNAIEWIFRIFAFFFANYWYYKKTRQDIFNIRDDDIATDEDAVRQISIKGGTSFASLAGALIAELFMQLVFLYCMALIFK